MNAKHDVTVANKMREAALMVGGGGLAGCFLLRALVVCVELGGARDEKKVISLILVLLIIH